MEALEADPQSFKLITLYQIVNSWIDRWAKTVQSKRYWNIFPNGPIYLWYFQNMAQVKHVDLIQNRNFMDPNFSGRNLQSIVIVTILMEIIWILAWPFDPQIWQIWVYDQKNLFAGMDT